tara:strand:+ start:3724 stop:4752 length:1029 start_codon:yes stop_codon:yes gene_type:complete
MRNLKEKNIFLQKIKNLTVYHLKKCRIYNDFFKFDKINFNKINSLEKLPFIPVRAFKEFELMSVKKKDVFKVLHSSGTSNQSPSRIFLDKKNSKEQINVLSKIFKNFFKYSRLPMLVIDSNIYKKKDKITLPARIAAIAGFSIFGKDMTFALNEDMTINEKNLSSFFSKYRNQDILIFGLTSIIWEKFISINNLINKKLNLKNAILIHGGGWKKLSNKGINNNHFKLKLKKNFNISKVHNYYGMIEQTGSIFFECNLCSHFVTNPYSEIIIRDDNLNPQKEGKKGIVQLISLLPTSYPGHNIITEDIGLINNKSDCSCSKIGKRFKIFGRLKKAEMRGCANV